MASPSSASIKRLFARTGNRCAFPDCAEQLAEDEENLIAEVCHICADKGTGKRYDPSQADEERQSYENLIILCPNHHTLIDSDETTYTTERLREMKRKHEAKSPNEFRIADPVATKIAHIVGGASVGVLLSEMVYEVGDLVRRIAQAALPSERKEAASLEDWGDLERVLIEPLKYAPKGQLRVIENDRTKLVYAITELFRRAGWRIERREANQSGAPPTPLFLFGVKSEYQLRIARQAVDEFFRRAGFVPVADGADLDARYSRGTARLSVGFAVSRR